MAGVAYYPGCSLRHSAIEFDRSTRIVLESLGIDYEIVKDWTCCGASPAHMTSHLLAQALATRNLRQAAKIGEELLAPCPACYQREKNAEVEVHADADFRAEVNEIMDEPYTGEVRVWSLPEFLKEKVGVATLAKLPTTDLSQLKVVPYYGCLLARPTELTGECDTEQPMIMDQLLAAAGADVVWWNYKTECCGASVGVPNKIIQQRLSEKILSQAEEAGADAIVAACPLCHQNLDMRQHQLNDAMGTSHHMPVLYLTQVIGLGLGFTPKEMMLDKHLIDPTLVVERAIAKAAEVRAEAELKAQEAAEKARRKAERKKKEAEAKPPAEGPAPATGDEDANVEERE
ncbi:MAG TPA: heterodisulfide reductase-related iron-sulfur binding cluster [Thermoleophilia bacterium]|nr:heterodisulfide reductase-related iron-sulfur binding cluster [Thermoleophilia bacterium]